MNDGVGRYRPLAADERKTEAPGDNANKADPPTTPRPRPGAPRGRQGIFRRKPHAIWTYRDANGGPLFHVARFLMTMAAKKFSRCAGRVRAGKAGRGPPRDRSTLSTSRSASRCGDHHLRRREGGGRGGADFPRFRRNHIERRRAIGGENRLGAAHEAARHCLAGHGRGGGDYA